MLNDLQPSAVFLPMGLANPDHVLTHDAGLAARAAMTEAAAGGGEAGALWFCYEDAGYKHLPGLMAWRVSKLFRSGSVADPGGGACRTGHGGQAQGHPSLRQPGRTAGARHLLSERLDANTPEQYWRLDPPPAGWERLMSSDDLDARRAD